MIGWIIDIVNDTKNRCIKRGNMNEKEFDFTKKNPKLLYINTSDELISLEDTIYLTFLHLLGFDVALFVPTGYNMEKYFNLKLMEEHQLGDYIYDIQIPDWESIPLSLHTSWRDRLFRHG